MLHLVLLIFTLIKISTFKNYLTCIFYYWKPQTFQRKEVGFKIITYDFRLVIGSKVSPIYRGNDKCLLQTYFNSIHLIFIMIFLSIQTCFLLMFLNVWTWFCPKFLENYCIHLTSWKKNVVNIILSVLEFSLYFKMLLLLYLKIKI